MAYEEREPTAMNERMPTASGMAQEGPSGSTPGQSGSTRSGGESSQMNMNRMRHAWQEGSPDEVRDEVRRIVEKGVAAVTGAIRGFTERARNDQLSQQAGEAVRRAGEAAQSVVKETGSQARSMRGTLKGTAKEVGQTTRDVGQTAGEEMSKAKQTTQEQVNKMKGSSSSGSSSSTGSTTTSGSSSTLGSDKTTSGMGQGQS